MVSKLTLALGALAVGSVAVLAVMARARPPPSPPATPPTPSTPSPATPSKPPVEIQPLPPAPPPESVPPVAPPPQPALPIVIPPPIEEITFPEDILRYFAQQGGVAVVFITGEPYEEQIEYAGDALRAIREFTGGHCAFPATGLWPIPVFRKRDKMHVGNAFVVFATLPQYYKDWAGYCRQMIKSALGSAFFRTYDYVIEF